MRRYQHAERMIRGITWQGKKELYAVLLRDLKRTDTTEHDLQHEYDEYDKYRRELFDALLRRFRAPDQNHVEGV